MTNRISLLLAALLLTSSAIAENTRYWDQSLYPSLIKGTVEGLSLKSDGSLSLGPRLDLIKESDSSYLWDTVEDSPGNLYFAGGTPGRVYKMPPKGEASVFFETKENEIHALAIDKQGRIYAAASPDGSIYRISPDGKSETFYSPGAKYIWDLAIDSNGNLFVATGDKGKIFKVTPQGAGSVFFSSDETHIRSLIIDDKNNLYAGTEGNGLIIRIGADASSFVLYESPKKEVTSLAIDKDGTLYAATVGDKVVVGTAPAQPVPLPGQTVKSVPSIFTLNLAGGSEVYRIAPNGSPQKIWYSKSEIIYTIALSNDRRLLLGTGNDGKIFAVDSDGTFSYLTRSPSSQVTNLFPTKTGMLAATSNPGRFYRISSEYIPEGKFTSEVFDASRTATWGRIQWRQQTPPDTSLRFETRSGNTSNPQLNWSPWQEAITDGAVGGVEAKSQSPRARFFQWKAILSSKNVSRTVELSSARAAYLPNNVAPVIEDVQNTPQGWKIPATLAPVAQPKTLSLPAIGTVPVIPVPITKASAAVNLNAEKGSVGVRWFAYDDNDDTLNFSVYIRGQAEKDWKLVKEGIIDLFYTWDSTNWPDGTYVAKVVATDAPSNPASEALTASREGTPFDIDNTPPEIRDLTATPVGKELKIGFRASDRMNSVQSAEYSIDGGEWKAAMPVSRVSDSRELVYDLESMELPPGEHTVVVRATDRVQNVGVIKTVVTLK